MSPKANFRVDPRLASLLGETYRSTENAIKELVDNCWDADATEVVISLPKEMTSDPIIIGDNGCGMTESEVRSEYLAIANDRRSRKGDRTPGLKRIVKGRKGIGKFAGLMVADLMKVETTARETSTTVLVSKEELLQAANAKDLEKIDLPIEVRTTHKGPPGTQVSLSDLNDKYEFPSPEKLKELLMLEYGREEDFTIRVNGEKLGLEDLSGKQFKGKEQIKDVGAIKVNFMVSEGPKPLKRAGLALRVKGKIVGKPSFFGLEDDPEIPPKLLRRVYGEVEADGLVDSVTADWAAIVENSSAYQAIVPVIQSRVKQAISQVFKREVGLQRARIQKQMNLRLAKLPEYRRSFAQTALETVMMRFYGESDERVETVASVVLDALEKDEYWQVIKQIDESEEADVEAFASALENFGLLDMALIANQARNRMRVLDSFEKLIRNSSTKESTIHKALESNLWILGNEFSLVASNTTLATMVDKYATSKFAGKRAKSRPDLFLAQDLSGGYLLIEFKRPSREITRDDQNQAVKYRDDLEPTFGHIDILLLGKCRDSSASSQHDPDRLRVFGYEALISTARTQLNWLLKELKSNEPVSTQVSLEAENG